MEGHSYNGVSNGRINGTTLLRRAAASSVARGDQGNDQGGQQGGRSEIEVARVLLFQEFPT